MIAVLIAILIACALGFGLLGYITGKRHKPAMRGLLLLVVALALVITVADVVTGFAIGMSHIVGPWLFGVGAGFLRRPADGN